jgi:hypothetical protein
MGRSIHWAFVTISWLLLLSIGLPADAVACSCMENGPPCEAAFQMEFVFAGTVQRLVSIPVPGAPPPPGSARLPQAYRVTFSDVEGFRGVDASAFEVLTPGSSAACGFVFKQGERYLVYASRNARGEIVTGLCSRTRRFDTAAEDLQFLRTLSQPPSDSPNVFGSVNHWESDLATGRPRDYGPVLAVPIILKNADRIVEATTDALGRYQLRVPPGRYQMSVLPGSEFSRRSLQAAIEIPDPRACAAVDFILHYAGRISGTVRHQADEAVEDVQVELMAVERIGYGGYIDTRGVASSEGRFEFTDVPPGRYVVGVDLVRRIERGVVYPRTYHPGTSDPNAATVVEVEAGESHPLPPLTLPAARRSHQLTGVVMFEDGRAAAGAFVSLGEGDATKRQVALAIKTGSDGSFSFVVREGLSYVAHASFRDDSLKKQYEGSAEPIVVAGDTGPIKVIISAR